jgi:hypothetical protein
LYQGWVEERTVRNGVEAKYDQAQEKINIVQSEKAKLEVKSEEYRTKAEAMQSQLEKLQAEQTRMDSEKAALKQQLEGHQGMIADLQKKVEELEKKAKDAQAACGVTPADFKTDPLSSPKPFENTPGSSAGVSPTSAPGTESGALVFKPATSAGTAPVQTATETAPSALVPAVTAVAPATVAAASKEPAREAVSPAQVTSAVAAPGKAKVLTVNRKFNFVVISQGLQDGLKMGDKLRVLKQGQEVATIQVEKLYDKFSAATLLEEDPKQQVVEGDEIRKI